MKLPLHIMACLALMPGCFILLGCEGEAHEEKVLETQIGDATYYANSLQGGETASGLKFHNRMPMAAHPSYPFGTVVRITNPLKGKSVTVVIVDRGPYGKNRREGAIIDLSRAAAESLGMIHEGQVQVRIDVLKWGDGDRYQEGSSVEPRAF